MGRFISADCYVAIGVGILENNMFSYALNNPINILDRNGHKPESLGTFLSYTLTFYYIQGIKDSIIIKEKDEVQILLQDCTYEVDGLIRLHGINVACDILSGETSMLYKSKHSSPLFATKNQISREIEEHIEGYYWALDKKVLLPDNDVKSFSAPFAFTTYGWLRKASEQSMNDFMLVKCRTIEICKNSKAENIYFYGRIYP